MSGYVALFDMTVDPPVPVGVAANPLIVSGSATGSNKVQGVTASNATPAENPVGVGGIGSSTVPTAVTTGNRTNLWTTLNGAPMMGGFSSNVTRGASAAQVWPMDLTGTPRPFAVGGYVSNGATQDAVAKPNIYKRVASSVAAGNPDFIKASAADLMQFWGLCGATAAYLQIYNKASAPVVGTDTPILTYPIPANVPFSQTIPNGGAYFATGLAFAFTTDAAGTTGSAAAAITAFSALAA